MSSKKEWSLARQITRGFAITSVLLSGVILCLSYWYVHRGVSREITYLASEEVEEMQVRFENLAQKTPQAFERIAAELGKSHPANPFAWRVWRRADLSLWHQVGPEEMLAQRVPLGQPPGLTRRVARSYFWETKPLTDELQLGLLIDASEQQRILARYSVSVLIGLGLAALIATLGGSVFARRVGRQLDEVARSVRRVTDTSQELELQLADAPVEIRQVAEALGVMLANIRSESQDARLITAGLAHELRAPIQNMLGEAEVGLLRERSPAQYQEILESQLDELRDLGRVVDNLVTLTSPDNPVGSRPTEHFDLGAEARLRVSREESHARRSGVELEVKTEGDLGLEGDREALILAIRNLVENAIEWSDAGGRVVLSITGEDHQVVVQVDDQGPGVPEENRKHIFDPFITTRSAHGRRLGYGLGLALAKRAVESHGGTIRVGPSGLGGASFQMELPRSPLFTGEQRGADS